MIYDTGLIILAYLLGSIPFGLLIPKLYGVEDIRKIGSGNIGATNALRACGVFGALLVTFFDIAKGVGPVLLAIYLGSSGLFSDLEYLKLIVGFAAIAGHIFPVFLAFKGGKGVNTALGVFLVLVPIATFLALITFIITLLISRYVSLGSILAAFVFFTAIVVFRYMNLAEIHPIYLPTGAILFMLIVLTHRSNIGRLMKGDENKFNPKAKKTKEVCQ